MAIAIDASSPAAATGTTAAITTASFTPPAGALLLVMFAASSGAGADNSISSVTNTGSAVTWTRLVRKNRNAGSQGGASTVDGGAEMWGATAPGGAVTVTVNAVAADNKLVEVMVLTGADTSALGNWATLAAANSIPSMSLPGCLTGSFVFAASSDARRRGLGTAGTGQTIISEANTGATTHTWRTTSALAAAGSQTMNLTAPTGEDYDLVLLEVRAGAPVSPPQIRGSIVPILRSASF